MKLGLRLVLLSSLLGLLLPALAPLGASPAWTVADSGLLPAGPPAVRHQVLHAPQDTVETVYSFVLSDEAPGCLIEHLIAQGHGDDTVFEVLGYLKAQSGGIISDEFYNDVATAPKGSEVFTARSRNFAGHRVAVQIAADGTVLIHDPSGVTYEGQPGYATVPSQDGEFVFTYAQDVAHYVYLGYMELPWGDRRDYYAFGIAWRGAPTPTPSPTATRSPSVTCTPTPTRTPTVTPTKAPRRPLYLPLVAR